MAMTKQSKKPLAHEQGGFQPAVPEQRKKRSQVGPMPTCDPDDKSAELKPEIERSKSKPQKQRSE
jgi:hypothetical protein